MPYYNVDQHIVFVDCLQFLKVYDDKHKLCENKENKKIYRKEKSYHILPNLDYNTNICALPYVKKIISSLSMLSIKKICTKKKQNVWVSRFKKVGSASLHTKF